MSGREPEDARDLVAGEPIEHAQRHHHALHVDETAEAAGKAQLLLGGDEQIVGGRRGCGDGGERGGGVRPRERMQPAPVPRDVARDGDEQPPRSIDVAYEGPALREREVRLEGVLDHVKGVLRAEALPPYQRVWLRADGKLPDDPLLHTIVLTYASDMTLLDTALLPHGGSWFDPTLFMTSLDHAMWFHRPFRADQWLLYSQDTPTATSGRGLARGLVFTQEGTLVASVVQEGLIRVARP